MTRLLSPQDRGVDNDSPVIKPYPFAAVPPRPLSPDQSPTTLVGKLRELLAVDGFGSRPEVWSSEDAEFKTSAEIFNGAVKTHAIILVKPLSAADVSATIKFCRRYDLDVSVKAGGTGVHGWSVAGHVILDMSRLNEITIALPDDATTLQDSFAKLEIRRESLSTVGPSKRPSLSETHQSSDSTTTSIKRSIADASLSDDEGEPNEKKRMDDIQEEETRTSSRSSEDVRSSSDEARSDSTPATSARGSEPFIKLPGRASFSSDPSGSAGSGSSSSSASGPQPRTTYVNPSPTTTSAFPFASTSFGAGPSSSISYPSGFPGLSPQLVLNTNPDPPPYTIVTFGAGIRSKQLDAATAASPYGAFHVPTSAFPVGSGQFMLGGFGFIGRKHGLAMDNVVEAELVLADGRIVWVGEGGKHGGEWKDHEDPAEVWWGLRGAGPSLGVVTRFRAKAYYLPSVYAGNLIYLFDKQTTPSLLRHVRDCVKGSPRSLYTNIIMTAGPPGSPAIVVIQLCYSGPRAEGDIYIQAISSWEGGRCLFQDFSERTFERQQVAVEEVLKGGQGRKWYIKSDMLMSMTDEVIDETCGRFHVVPDGCTWLFEYTGGSCMAEVKDSAFPVSHRESAFTVAALHQWGHTEVPALDTRCVTTAEDWVTEVIHAHSPGGPLPCFLQSAAKEEVAGVFGENWSRLERLKAQIDPDNVFKNSGWPRINAVRDSAAASFFADGDDVPLDGQAYANGDDLVSDGEARPDVPAPTDQVQNAIRAEKGKSKVNKGSDASRIDSTGDVSMESDAPLPMASSKDGTRTGAPEAAGDMPTDQRGTASVVTSVPGK